MIYLDTSVLIAVHTPEAGSQRAVNWMAGNPDQNFAISLWTITEFASALSRKVRMHRLALDERARIGDQFELFRESLAVLVPGPEDFQLATRMMDEPLHGLRAGDALHLAITVRSNLTLATFDRTLRETAAAFGADIAPL